MHCELCLSEHTSNLPCGPSSRTPTWGVHVHHPQGVEAHGVEIGKGGLFLSCSEPFPALFTRLELTLWLAGEALDCEGEVVRHVDPAHARAWGMSPGIGVQLLPTSPRLKELLSRARATRHEDAATSDVPSK